MDVSVLAGDRPDDQLDDLDQRTPDAATPIDASDDGLTDRIQAATPYDMTILEL